MWCDWQFWAVPCPPAASPAVLCVPYSAWSFSNMTRVTVFLKEGGRESRNVKAGAGPEAPEERNWNDRKKRRTVFALIRQLCEFLLMRSGMNLKQEGKSSSVALPKIISQLRCMQHFRSRSNKYWGIYDETLSRVSAVVLLGLGMMFVRLRFYADYYNWLNKSLEKNRSRTVNKALLLCLHPNELQTLDFKSSGDQCSPKSLNIDFFFLRLLKRKV